MCCAIDELLSQSCGGNRCEEFGPLGIALHVISLEPAAPTKARLIVMKPFSEPPLHLGLLSRNPGQLAVDLSKRSGSLRQTSLDSAHDAWQRDGERTNRATMRSFRAASRSMCFHRFSALVKVPPIPAQARPGQPSSVSPPLSIAVDILINNVNPHV